MANYTAVTRSNYFKVKDEQAFLEWVESVPDLGHWKNNEGLHAIRSDTDGWPSFQYIEDEEGYEVELDLELAPELSKHLAEGEVAVLLEAGYEKLRYITGHAVAVAWDGRIEYIDLNQIYDRAKEVFGVEPTPAEY